MLLPTSVKRHCSGCKTARAPSNQYFQLLTTMAKNPDTTRSAQKLVRARTSASYGETSDGPSTSHSAQKPVKAKVSAGYGEMSGGDSGSRFRGQVPEIPVVPVAHASAVSPSKGKAPIRQEPSAPDAIISRTRIPKGLKFKKKVDVESSMTSPRVQGASHVLSERSDAGPSYSVESVRSRVGSEKLIPSPPRVEDILDWEWVNTEFKSDIAPQSQQVVLSDAPLMSLALYYCDVVERSMKEAPLSLAPHQMPINEARAELISRMSPYVYFRG